MKKICLNMIVKNEAKVIRRCLASVKGLIDYWVIVDTGSNDETKAIIQDFLKDIPGELHERPWVDFSHNRNEALELAKNKGDYLLFMDADDELEFSDNFKRPDLTLDYYLIVQEKKTLLSMTSQILAFVNNHLEWRWEGVLHEIMMLREGRTSALLSDIQSIYHQDGDRSQDPDKFLKDAALLEKAHQTPRNVLYLALSYEIAGKNEEALKTYEKRSAMGDWEEEVFYSLFRVAHIQRRLGMSPEVFTQNYLKAYQYRPSRAEPLYWLADYYLNTENFVLGYTVAKLGASIPIPEIDLFYVERFVYEYGLLNLKADCAYHLKRHRETYDDYQKILSVKNLPDDVKRRIKNNLLCLVV